MKTDRYSSAILSVPTCARKCASRCITEANRYGASIGRMLLKVCDRALLPKKLTLRPVETAGGSGTRVDITRAPRAVCRRLPDGGKRHSRLGLSRALPATTTSSDGSPRGMPTSEFFHRICAAISRSRQATSGQRPFDIEG